MFKGIIPPVVIFFDQQGEIDFDLNKKHMDYLIDSGVDGVLLLGSSSEFSSLTLSEKKQYLGNLIPHINNRIPVLVGVGNTVLKGID
ncbi:dihydrodipicolinate synthase family protein [Lysinibacillus telephonicus]|uniref:dihydrodipicolinate synthase family protein n=1 Tax=Lysinibacillus telephonicus TaxID=1714840 RepID=UPI0031FE2A22